jgi:hypothetical protein
MSKSLSHLPPEIRLYRKLFALMKAIPSITKTGKMEDDSGDYAYHERNEIVRIFRAQLIRLRLLCLPSRVIGERWGNPTASGGTLNYSQQTITYRFIDVQTGFGIECEYVGHGCDPLDKDAPKAAIQALKYFLVNSFFVDGIELDGDDSSEQAAMREVQHGAKWEGIVSKVEPDDTTIQVAGDLGYVFYALIENKQERCFVNEQRKHIYLKIAKKSGKTIRFRAMRHESGTLVVTKLSR